MRKTTAIVLTVAMALSALTGCGSSGGQTEAPKASDTQTEAAAEGAGSSEEAVELNLAIFKGGYGDAFWTAAADAFSKEHPNVTFKIDCDPSIGEKVNSSMLAGETPDFIYCPSSNPSGLAQRLIKDQALADLTDVFESEELKGKILDGFLDTSLSQPYGDGKVYLAPLYYTANGLFYNATLFEEAGLAVPATWDEFFAMGDEIKGKDIAGKSDRSLFTYQGGNAPGYMETVIVPLLTSRLGIDGMNECFSYVEGSWEKPGVKEVFDLVAKLGDGYLLPNTTGIDHTTAQTAVMNGTALFVPCGSWIVGEMADITGEEINGKPFAWGFAPVPAMDASADKYLMSSVEEVYIPADAKNIDAAKEFLKFLYSDEAIKLNAEKTGGIPPVVGATELTKDILDPMILSTFKAFDDGYKPYIGGFAAVDSEIVPKKEFYGHVNAVVDGKETVDDWIAACVKLSDDVRDSLVKAE